MWALGVKEVWRVAEAARPGHPHDGLAAAAGGASSASSAARSSTRWARSMLTIGMVVGLDYRDAVAVGARPAAGAEDASADRGRSSRAASGSSGARRRSRRAGSSRCRAGCTRPGCCSCGDGAGLVNMPALKGIHYAIESGPARRRGGVARRCDGRRRRGTRRLRRGAALPRSSGATCARCATCARRSARGLLARRRRSPGSRR